jgi:SagB-type dehydrogenase family enzyme
MFKKSFVFVFVISFGILMVSFIYGEILKKEAQLESNTSVDQIKQDYVILPAPVLKSTVSIEEAILHRRSRRLYEEKPIILGQLSQVLWAAQGVTGQIGNYKLRAAPSAGALYPMELYIILPKGVYHYLPEKHKLEKVKDGDLRPKLAKAALDQRWVRKASCNIIITAVYERTMAKYSERGIRYAILEAGSVAENIYLQAESLGLGTVSVGAFIDKKVQETLGIPEDRRPLLIMPLGYPWMGKSD